MSKRNPLQAILPRWRRSSSFLHWLHWWGTILVIAWLLWAMIISGWGTWTGVRNPLGKRFDGHDESIRQGPVRPLLTPASLAEYLTERAAENELPSWQLDEDLAKKGEDAITILKNGHDCIQHGHPGKGRSGEQVPQYIVPLPFDFDRDDLRRLLGDENTDNLAWDDFEVVLKGRGCNPIYGAPFFVFSERRSDGVVQTVGTPTLMRIIGEIYIWIEAREGRLVPQLILFGWEPVISPEVLTKLSPPLPDPSLYAMGVSDARRTVKQQLEASYGRAFDFGGLVPLCSWTGFLGSMALAFLVLLKYLFTIWSIAKVKASSWRVDYATNRTRDIIYIVAKVLVILGLLAILGVGGVSLGRGGGEPDWVFTAVALPAILLGTILVTWGFMLFGEWLGYVTNKYHGWRRDAQDDAPPSSEARRDD